MKKYLSYLTSTNHYLSISYEHYHREQAIYLYKSTAYRGYGIIRFQSVKLHQERGHKLRMAYLFNKFKYCNLRTTEHPNRKTRCTNTFTGIDLHFSDVI